MFVYVIVNKETLKLYIGKTISKNLTQYLQKKVWDAQKGRWNGRSRLFAAMQKYPSTVWSIHPLFEGTSDEEISAREILLIKSLAVQNPNVGYNICGGGEGHRVSPSAETRAKLSISHRGKKHSLETKAKLSIWGKTRVGEKNNRYGVHLSEETRKKIKTGNLGKTRTLATRLKMGASKAGERHPNFGKHLSEQTRKKISAANLGRMISEETRLKLQQSHLGKTNLLGYRHSDEARKNMSLAQQGKVVPLNVRIKISRSHMGKVKSKAHRQALSEAAKHNWEKRHATPRFLTD